MYKCKQHFPSRRSLLTISSHTFCNICKPQAILPIKTLPSRRIIVIRARAHAALLIMRSNNNNSKRKYGADALQCRRPTIYALCAFTRTGRGGFCLKYDRFTAICGRESRGDLCFDTASWVYCGFLYVDAAASGRLTSDLCVKRLSHQRRNYDS